MILITGATGFIGSSLVSALLKRGYDSKTIRILVHKTEFSKSNQRVEVIKGDITKKESVSSAMKGVNCVFHFAALIDNLRININPYLSNKINVGGTLNILDAAKNEGARVIFASSNAVYGEPKYIPVDEKHPTNPKSLYGANKLCGEIYCNFYRLKYGLPVVCLRYANIYGSGMKVGVISSFFRSIGKGKPIIIDGDGQQTRQFTYIDDAIDATLLAYEKQVDKGTYNISGCEPVSIIEVAKLVKDIYPSVIIRFKNRREKNEKNNFHLSNEKAKKIFGYSPRINIREGIYLMMKKYMEVRK